MAEKMIPQILLGEVAQKNSKGKKARWQRNYGPKEIDRAERTPVRLEVTPQHQQQVQDVDFRVPPSTFSDHSPAPQMELPGAVQNNNPLYLEVTPQHQHQIQDVDFRVPPSTFSGLSPAPQMELPAAVQNNNPLYMGVTPLPGTVLHQHLVPGHDFRGSPGTFSGVSLAPGPGGPLPPEMELPAAVQDNTLLQAEDASIIKPMKVGPTNAFDQIILYLGRSPNYWHKFIVQGGADLPRTTVMKTVMKIGLSPMSSADFFPALYRIEPPHATFLMQNCFPVIKKLFQNNFKLLLEGHKTPDREINFEVILCFAHSSHIDLSLVFLRDTVYACLLKRYDSKTRTLDLSNFSEDSELLETFYCPLWMPKMMKLVLDRVKFLRKPIENLLLNRNELTNVMRKTFLEELTTLQKLDLSDNQLDSLISLRSFPTQHLTELVLDNNPVCAQFLKEDYIREVCSVLPALEKLDGVLLGDRILPLQTRNFSVTDAVDLVDQFLERFFTIYDSQNRHWLRGFYHEEACFSLSANFLEHQSTSTTARLHHYLMNSRNLLKMSNYMENYKLLYHGPEEILSTMTHLPKTEHDPFSFCVDVVYYTGEKAVFTVSGLFREYINPTMSLIRSFSRTFVLVWVGGLQYQICNEILNISNATSEQAQAAFKIQQKTPCLTKIAISAFEPPSAKDQDQMAECMAEFTDMNVRWARKCLQESKWKFREALQVFTELLKMEKIPPEAFVKA